MLIDKEIGVYFHLLLAGKTNVDLICVTDFGFVKMHLLQTWFSSCVQYDFANNVGAHLWEFVLRNNTHLFFERDIYLLICLPFSLPIKS